MPSDRAISTMVNPASLFARARISAWQFRCVPSAKMYFQMFII